ncbi:hypothetical protein LguiA_028510 [Lonicera macranthoides]
MGISSWLYTNNKKNKVLKIVHPGGHAELHDRPIVAADIIRRNPRCCLAHPNVFQQPWAIVPPDTTLMPGQKFYVVPLSTIRKLQKLSLKYHPSLAHEIQATQNSQDEDIVQKTDETDTYKVGDSLNKTCFNCFIIGIKRKASDEDKSKELRSSSSFGSSEAEGISGKRITGVSQKGGSPKRHSSLDNWEPNLESISEESGER